MFRRVLITVALSLSILVLGGVALTQAKPPRRRPIGRRTSGPFSM